MNHTAPTQLRRRPARRGALAATALAGLCLVTAACADASAAARDPRPAPVAASAGPAAAPAASAPSSAAPRAGDAHGERPQLRLDSTTEEVYRYRKAYAECLKDNGMPQSAGTYTPAQESAYQAARKACQDKVPLLPPELDPKQNPHYAASVRVQVKCMQEYGFKVHLVPAPASDPNALGWTYDELPGDDVDIDKIQNECRAKGFGGGAAITPGPA
ncbi:hypothetical protein ABZT47_16075 [Sphaerisporangium sp. NPDC005289]|uniref:hypothetical protein n=1 Tax=Sphaerisporangium sp. NPDC005289 TaxID=3155247 RepID=UPI0033BC9B0B